MAFPHLTLKQKYQGKPRYTGSGPTDDERTLQNIADRQGHASRIRGSVQQIRTDWAAAQEGRLAEGLPNLPDRHIIPVLLQVDPIKFDIESFPSAYNIEIISEEEDGFILGASIDDFQGLSKKIDQFSVSNSAKAQARLWDINDGKQWKLSRILSEALLTKWESIQDDDELILDIGIACYVKIRNFPQQGPTQSNEAYQRVVDNWHEEKAVAEEERMNLADARQIGFENLLLGYEGELIAGAVNAQDSFGYRIRVSGIGLKDIALNYQYVFDIVEVEETTIPTIDTVGYDTEEVLEFIAPAPNAPKVCVIDSGIMEGHRYLANAIDVTTSRSFLPGVNDVNDYVVSGGHGTRVAGAVLYANNVPTGGTVQPVAWIQNARVLDDSGHLPNRLYPPKLMRDIVEQYPDTKIFK